MSSITLKLGTFSWLFRLRIETPDLIDPVLDESCGRDVPGIRCPLCKWRPKQSDRWMCWDCDFPEYFYYGCGTEWNSFDTRGVCPTCLHQWRWTSCLRCFLWSKHEDWYENADE